MPMESSDEGLAQNKASQMHCDRTEDAHACSTLSLSPPPCIFARCFPTLWNATLFVPKEPFFFKNIFIYIYIYLKKKKNDFLHF